MPGKIAEAGDVYKVRSDATDSKDAKPLALRPTVCVAPRPLDPYAWTGIGRTTSDVRANDLPSPVTPEAGLTKEGWWSLRFIKSVAKEFTGNETRCKFSGKLPSDSKQQVMDFYKDRNNADLHLLKRPRITN